MGDTAQLRIGMLGELAASSDGRPLDLGGPRQRAVLALLLLARGEVVPAERLADSLWGDRAPADTAAALQSYVSHLRRRLQPGTPARARSAVIVSEGRGYAVRLPDSTVDAWQFESLVQRAHAATDPAQVSSLLQEALGLWRGPALADYADEPWAEAEIARLTELRAVTRERLFASRLELGETAIVVPELEAMVVEEPLREERWRLLVLALYRAHRQADALKALRRARSTLAEELGVDPGPALRTLEADILAHSPALDVPRQRASAVQPAAERPAPAMDLADRERELAAVHAALDDLARGEPRLLLIEGAAGIGKTRLLTEARRLAVERSVQVLSARGSQLEQAFGFGAVRQLFEPALAAPQRREELLVGAASSARGVFDLRPDDQPDGSFSVLHGLYWLSVNLATNAPLMLAVDDLQWCDSASLRYLAYLVRRLDALPVLVVGTIRSGEGDEHEVLTELALEPAAVVVRPEPLSAEAIAAIVGDRLGRPASMLFTTACHRTTSGNPLLLRQLLRGLEADGVRPDAAHADMVVAVGSRAVSNMVLLRLRRLPPVVSTVARAAAVLGDGAVLPTVASMARLSPDETAAALSVLSRAEVVRDEIPLTFVHPLVREAVYRDLSAAERELQHERAAHVLAAAGATAEQVAAHLLLAPHASHPDIVEVLRAAARTAAGRGASESAVTYLRRALAQHPAEGDRRDVLLELGPLEAMVDGPAAAAHLQEAYTLLGDDPARAEVAIATARTHVFASPPGVATAFARAAAADLPLTMVDQRQGLLALERISAFMHGLDDETWRTRPAPEPRGEGPGAQMVAATAAFETMLDGEDRERAVGLARFALAGDRLWAHDSGLFWVVAANVLMLADDDLADFWSRARAMAHARGSLFAAMATSVWEGFWHWRRGELEEALSCAAVALDQDRMWGGTGVGGAYVRWFQIGALLDRGDVAGARQVADAAHAEPAAGEGLRLLRQVTARLLVAEKRYDEALAEVGAATARTPIPNPAWNPWRSITAEAVHGLHRTPEAITLLAEEVTLLRRWGAPSSLGRGLRLLGQLLGADGLGQLRESVSLLSRTPAAVELARAQSALGSSPGVPDQEAIPLLEAASETAHARGALEIRDLARDALRRRGRPVDPREDALRRPSSTERSILDLAAQGLSVNEVAQRLLLTPGIVRAALEAEASTVLP